MEQREHNDLLAPHEGEGAQGASTPSALEYTSPKSAVEASTKAIERRRRGALSEVADLQRRAIAALEECAIATFLLTNALHHASPQRFDAIGCDRVLSSNKRATTSTAPSNMYWRSPAVPGLRAPSSEKAGSPRRPVLEALRGVSRHSLPSNGAR